MKHLHLLHPLPPAFAGLLQQLPTAEDVPLQLVRFEQWLEVRPGEFAARFCATEPSKGVRACYLLHLDYVERWCDGARRGCYLRLPEGDVATAIRAQLFRELSQWT